MPVRHREGAEGKAKCHLLNHLPSLWASVSACPLMLRPWLGVPRALMSGRPDTAATLASQELRLAHLGASEAASS